MLLQPVSSLVQVEDHIEDATEEAAEYAPLESLISAELAEEAASATVHGQPLFPSLRRRRRAV